MAALSTVSVNASVRTGAIIPVKTTPAPVVPVKATPVASQTDQQQVAAWQANGVAQGLKPYNPTDPFAGYYATICARNTPLKLVSTNAAGFAIRCEAQLRARGLIYMKKTPGDCPRPTQFSNSDLQALSFSSSAAEGTTSILGAIGVLSGPLTAGIGLGVTVAAQAISQIFQNHAKAVKNEQDTLCSVASYVNQVISYLDNQVARGLMDPTDAEQTLKNYAAQANSGLDTIKNDCNAACYFEGYLNALVDFSTVYYARTYPNIVAAQPVSNPASGSLVSGAVLGPPNVSTNVSSSPVIEYQSTPGGTYTPVLQGSHVNAAAPVGLLNSAFVMYGAFAVVIILAILLFNKEV